MIQLRKLYEKYRETFWYLVFGGLTTLLNLVVFYVMYEWMGIDKVVSNTVAWIAGVLFAFVTNKLFVFRVRDGAAKKGFGNSRLSYRPESFRVFDTVFLLAFTGMDRSLPGDAGQDHQQYPGDHYELCIQ